MVECDGTIPTGGSGGTDAVQLIVTFTGTTSFAVTTTNTQSYQLGNNYSVQVTELNSPFRTCTSGNVNGNYQVSNSGVLNGFPRLWPTDGPNAANPAVDGTLTKNGFGAGSPVFPISCGTWKATLDAAFNNGVTAFSFDYSMEY